MLFSGLKQLCLLVTDTEVVSLLQNLCKLSACFVGYVYGKADGCQLRLL